MIILRAVLSGIVDRANAHGVARGAYTVRNSSKLLGLAISKSALDRCVGAWRIFTAHMRISCDNGA